MKYTNILIRTFIIMPIVSAGLCQAGPFKKTPQELDDKILAARARLEALQANPKLAIPQVVMRSARGIIILRKLKVGLGIGAEAGGGVALVKSPEGVWSPPAFVGAADASWGLQIGAEDEDIVMILMTEDGLQMLKEGKKGNVGIELKAQAGPINAGKDFDTNKLSPILIYKNTTGGFVGASLKGGGIIGAKRKNQTYYGMTLPGVLFSGEAYLSQSSRDLINSIRRFSGQTVD